MSLTPKSLAFVASLCPYPLTGISDEQLGDVIDAWLADQFASEDHIHIHGFDDDRGDAR